MFLVNEDRKRHEEIINSVSDIDKCAAVIIATAYFEWILRRSILALGWSPTKEMRGADGALGKNQCGGGMDGYKKAWNNQVHCRLQVRLNELIKDWDFFTKEAYMLRHRLVHGVTGSAPPELVEKSLISIMSACRALTNFAAGQNVSINKRIVRRKMRSSQCKPSCNAACKKIK